jgi:hypothetical protein
VHTRGLVGKTEGKRPLLRTRHRHVDNTHLALGRSKWQALVNVVMNLQAPQNAEV